MAGKLVQVATNTVTSAVANVTLTGIDSDDVYMVAVNNFTPTTDNVSVSLKFTVSGTADSSSNYDRAFKFFKADTTFSNISSTNQTELLVGNIGTGTSESYQAIYYLYNFNNASEYSFCTVEVSARDLNGNLLGGQGGGVLTVAQATDGVQYFMQEGNITVGKFRLFGLAK